MVRFIGERGLRMHLGKMARAGRHQGNLYSDKGGRFVIQNGDGHILRPGERITIRHPEREELGRKEGIKYDIILDYVVRFTEKPIPLEDAELGTAGPAILENSIGRNVGVYKHEGFRTYGFWYGLLKEREDKDGGAEYYVDSAFYNDVKIDPWRNIAVPILHGETFRFGKRSRPLVLIDESD